jgi:hypothetical protein
MLFFFAARGNQCFAVVFEQWPVVDVGWFEHGLLRLGEFDTQSGMLVS